MAETWGVKASRRKLVKMVHAQIRECCKGHAKELESLLRTKRSCEASEVARSVNVLSGKPNDLSLVSRTDIKAEVKN